MIAERLNAYLHQFNAPLEAAIPGFMATDATVRLATNDVWTKRTIVQSVTYSDRWARNTQDDLAVGVSATKGVRMFQFGATGVWDSFFRERDLGRYRIASGTLRFSVKAHDNLGLSLVTNASSYSGAGFTGITGVVDRSITKDINLTETVSLSTVNVNLTQSHVNTNAGLGLSVDFSYAILKPRM